MNESALMSCASFLGMLLVSATCSTAQDVPTNVPPAPLVTGVDAGGLASDIQDLQQSIDAATDSEKALVETRTKVAEFISRAEALANAGDLSGAELLLDEAQKTALPEDNATQSRVMLSKVSLKIRRGDLSGATSLLDKLSAMDSLTPRTAKRIADLSSLIASQNQSLERDKAIEAVALASDAAAIDAARQEAQRDPGNFTLRLVLVDLLRKAGDFQAAETEAEALLNEPAVRSDADVSQRAILAIGRIAVDQGRFDAARKQLEALRFSPQTAQKDRRVAELETRIAKKESGQSDDGQTNERKALQAEIEKLGPSEALKRVKAASEASPDNLGIRLLYADLLRKAKRLEDARKVGNSILDAATGEVFSDERQRTYVLLARADVDQENFKAARGYLERLALEAPSAKRDERIADITKAIAYGQRRADERRVAEAQKAREQAAKERQKAIDEQIRMAIDAAKAKGPDEGLIDIKFLRDANPGNVTVANSYARALARVGHWKEAEAVYLELIGNTETASDQVLVDNESAVLGLADLYLRTNRIDLSNKLLARLSQAHVATSTPSLPRIGELQAKVDNELKPDTVSGSAKLTIGYDNNVSAPDDDDNDVGGTAGQSTFANLDLRARYEKVISDNADRLFIQGRIQSTPYFEVSNVDRLTGELSTGFVYNVPDSRTKVESLVGLGARFIDYQVYQQTIFGQVTVETDLTPRLDSKLGIKISANDFDNNDRDNITIAGDSRLRYKLTDSDEFSIAFNARYEAAEKDYETRLTIGPTFGIKHNFSFDNMDGFYLFGSYNPRFTFYGGEAVAGVDIGRVREDLSHRFEIGIGREFAEDWKVELNGSYVYRDSNFDSKDSDGGKISLSLTRSFGP